MHKLRVARPTDRLADLLSFYCDGVGLHILTSFTDHAGFDGVILGHPEAPYHLEFTHHRGHSVGRAPTQDHLLVWYMPDETEWKTTIARMVACGYTPVPSYNPFWDTHGKTFEDVDGYRVVFQNAVWNA